MNDWRERMIEEHEQLSGRLERLRAFLHTTEYEALSEEAASDLRKQYAYMQGYHQVLTRRISRARVSTP